MVEQKEQILTPAVEAVSRRFDRQFAPAYKSGPVQAYKPDGYVYADFPDLIDPLAKTAQRVQNLFRDQGELTVVVFPEEDFLRALGLPSGKTWISGCCRSSSGEGVDFELTDLFCLAPYHGERRAAPVGWDERQVENLYKIYDSHEWTHVVLDRIMPYVLKNKFLAFHEAMAELTPKVLLGGLATLPDEASSFLLSLPHEAMVAWVDINQRGLFVFDGSVPHLNRAYASCLLGGVAILDVMGDGDFQVGFENLLSDMKQYGSQGDNSQFVPRLLQVLRRNGCSLSDTNMALRGQIALERSLSEKGSM